MLEVGAGCGWGVAAMGRLAGWGLTLGRLAAWLRSVDEAGPPAACGRCPRCGAPDWAYTAKKGNFAKKGRHLQWRCNKGSCVRCNKGFYVSCNKTTHEFVLSIVSLVFPCSCCMIAMDPSNAAAGRDTAAGPAAGSAASLPDLAGNTCGETCLSHRTDGLLCEA